jgi:nitrate reductase gamma subunit
VPIAFVYNVTHYFTLLVTQGTQIVRIASDPFGWHWHLFGSAMRSTDPLILDAGTVWHTQVALILIGHILGVYLSHLEALRVFRGTRRAVVSQLPMLFLMIVFTTVGLWILSLPIAGGQVIVPSG